MNPIDQLPRNMGSCVLKASVGQVAVDTIGRLSTAFAVPQNSDMLLTEALTVNLAEVGMMVTQLYK